MGSDLGVGVLRGNGAADVKLSSLGVKVKALNGNEKCSVDARGRSAACARLGGHSAKGRSEQFVCGPDEVVRMPLWTISARFDMERECSRPYPRALLEAG